MTKTLGDFRTTLALRIKIHGRKLKRLVLPDAVGGQVAGFSATPDVALVIAPSLLWFVSLADVEHIAELHLSA